MLYGPDHALQINHLISEPKECPSFYKAHMRTSRKRAVSIRQVTRSAIGRFGSFLIFYLVDSIGTEQIASRNFLRDNATPNGTMGVLESYKRNP